VREFLTVLTGGKKGRKVDAIDSELEKLFAMSDRKHVRRRRSVGPLDRGEHYQGGRSRS
jgi:hypothetical protein